MELFTKEKKKDSELWDQMKIFATNIEVLNQKLIQNPEVGMSPGEESIKNQLIQVSSQLSFVQNVVKSIGANPQSVHTDLIKEIKVILTQVQELNRHFTDIVNLYKREVKVFEEQNAYLSHTLNSFYRTIESLKKDIEVGKMRNIASPYKNI